MQALSLHRILDLSLDNQSKNLQESTAVIVSDSNAKNAITTGNSSYLQQKIVRDDENSDATILIVTDSSGRILADKNNPSRIGGKFTSLNSLIKNQLIIMKKLKSFEVIKKEDLIKESNSIYEKVKTAKKPTDGSKKDIKKKL